MHPPNSNQQHTRGPRLNTLYNVRDLGGYTAQDGQMTQPGRFLRADAPIRLDEHDRLVLASYPVRTVVDLRSDSEIRSAPNLFAQDATVSYHHVSLMGDDIGKAMADLVDHAYDQAKTQAKMQTNIGSDQDDQTAPLDSRACLPFQVGPSDFYIMLLDRSQESIGRVMKILADAPPGASLFNCSHGKDRTGVIAALLLLLAGVSEDDVIENYRVSDILLQPWFDTFIHEIPEKDLVFYNTNPLHMRKTLDHLTAQYGSAAHFLDRCGVAAHLQERLRAKLLNPYSEAE